MNKKTTLTVLIAVAVLIVVLIFVFGGKKQVTDKIYEIIPGFVLGLVAAVIVSLLTKKPDEEVLALFDRVASKEEIPYPHSL